MARPHSGTVTRTDGKNSVSVTPCGMTGLIRVWSMTPRGVINLTVQLHHVLSGVNVAEIVGPGLPAPATLGHYSVTPVSLRYFVADHMTKAKFNGFVVKVSVSPIRKARAHTMRGVAVRVHSPEQFEHGHIGKRLAGCAGEHVGVSVTIGFESGKQGNGGVT